MIRTGAGMLPVMTSLVDRLLPDQLWQRIQPLLPDTTPAPRRAPRRVPDRNCVAALIFMPAPAPPEPLAGQGVGLRLGYHLLAAGWTSGQGGGV